MKTFVLVIGPPAVGKMTVGRELAARMRFAFAHNHQTIDPLIGVFPFGSPPFKRLVASFRRQLFAEVAASDHAGFVYSFVWAFGFGADRATVDEWIEIFRGAGWRCVLVELRASFETRRVRNRLPDRLEAKASKRDLARSEAILEANEREWRMAGTDADDLSMFAQHLVFDSENASAAEVAEAIAVRLGAR